MVTVNSAFVAIGRFFFSFFFFLPCTQLLSINTRVTRFVFNYGTMEYFIIRGSDIPA